MLCHVSEQPLAALPYFSFSFRNLLLCHLAGGLGAWGEAAFWRAALSGGSRCSGGLCRPSPGAPGWWCSRGFLRRRSCRPALGLRRRAAAGCLLLLPPFRPARLAALPGRVTGGAGGALRCPEAAGRGHCGRYPAASTRAAPPAGRGWRSVEARARCPAGVPAWRLLRVMKGARGRFPRGALALPIVSLWRSLRMRMT